MAKKPTTEEPEDSAKGLTKTAMIEAAINAGFEKPKAGCEWIKEKYGVEIIPPHFSSVKNSFRKKEGTQVSPGRRTTKPAPVPTSTNASTELATEIKKLVDTYGADAVVSMSQMAALFAK